MTNRQLFFLEKGKGVNNERICNSDGSGERGIVTPEMKTVAEKEFTAPEIIRERVAVGQIAIPANINP